MSAPLRLVQLVRVTLATVALTSFGGLAACGSDPFTCFYDGKSRDEGSAFPSTDGCNTCTCTTNGIQCTAMACVTTCTYDGETHQVGQAFPATDGCNTCTCGADGNVACTEIACVTGCDYNGTRHEVGSSFPATDGCNTCSCEPSGNVACTTVECNPVCTFEGNDYTVGQSRPLEDGCNTCICEATTDGADWACTNETCTLTCNYDRQTFEVGQSFPARDGCNTCTCEATTDGTTISCTEMVCPTSCEYGGDTWEIGAEFRAEDGCNSCSCLPTGEVDCTKRLCICNPENEWWRSYVATDPAQCDLIRYSCDEPTSQFRNACGCGCQQPLSCEQVIDCDPRECDAAAVMARCPYSFVETAERCTSELSCSDDFATCRAPGEGIGCGRCFNPPPDQICGTDRDCGRGEICEPARCACNGESMCVPGCELDRDCGEGQVCGLTGRCERAPCATEADCPDNFTCIEGGQCQRSPCTESSSCDDFCVKGSCYATRGTCSAAIP